MKIYCVNFYQLLSDFKKFVYDRIFFRLKYFLYKKYPGLLYYITTTSIINWIPARLSRSLYSSVQCWYKWPKITPAYKHRYKFSLKRRPPTPTAALLRTGWTWLTAFYWSSAVFYIHYYFSREIYFEKNVIQFLTGLLTDDGQSRVIVFHSFQSTSSSNNFKSIYSFF